MFCHETCNLKELIKDTDKAYLCNNMCTLRTIREGQKPLTEGHK